VTLKGCGSFSFESIFLCRIEDALMLNVVKVSKSFGVETVLDEVSFVLNAGEQVALIGPNGCGKSSLLRILAGVEGPDSGMVAKPPEVQLGWLPQELRPGPEETVGEVVRAGLGDWKDLRVEVETLAEKLTAAKGKELTHILVAYDRALTMFQSLGGYQVDYQVKSTLAHLGLRDLSLSKRVAQLSGGERTRVGLAAVLMAQPDLLLLDEPTNHLDIKALEWLEGWLSEFQGTVLLVSHDRVFLDRTVSKVLELEGGRITEYRGNYSQYTWQKADERAQKLEEWKDKQAEIRRIKHDIARTKAQAKDVELSTTSREPGVRRYAKKVARKALSREKKLTRFLESTDRVDKPGQRWDLKVDFGEMPHHSKQLIELIDVGQRYDRWLYRHATLTLRHAERVVLLGPNGSGKSTLLRTIIGELRPQEGTVKVGANVTLGYLPQEQDTLAREATALSVIRESAPMSETEARNFLHYFLFAGDGVFVPVGKLSPGERSRLLLARVVAEGANCLILDEPINHLDIPSRERFEGALAAFPGAILVAVHDRAFIDRFATKVWSLEDGTIRPYLDRQEMLRVKGTKARRS
jgi:ATP-binding cassette subfamily F protein 3